MKHFTIPILIIAVAFNANAQVHQWSFGVGGTISETIQAIANGGNGTTVITGSFGSTDLDLDPSPSQSIAVREGGYDIYLAKYEEDSLLWQKTFTGPGFSSANDLAVYANGDILVAGNFNGVVNFDPNGTYELDSGTGADAYVAKYDANGNFISVFAIEGDFQTSGLAVELDGSDNLYLAGLLSDSADFDPGAGEVFINNDPSGFFLAKYSPAGTYLWALSVTGVGGTDVKDLEVTDDGIAYITGLFQQTIDLDPGPGTDNHTSDGVDSYVMKVDASGVYQWGRVFTGNNNQVTFGVGFAPGFAGVTPDGVYICGRFTSEIDLDPTTTGTEIIPSPTSATAFVTKLDGDGTYQWGRYIANQGDGKFMDVSAFGSVHLAGVFNGTITLPDSTTIYSNGGSDIVYVEYDDQGIFQSHMIFGGPSNEDLFTGGAIMDDLSLTFGGVYYGTIDFGPGTDTIPGPTAQGNEDLFVAHYYEVLTPNVSELTEASVNFYPNPARSNLRVVSEALWTHYSIMDLAGRAVASGKNSNSIIQIAELVSGTYSILLFDQGGLVAQDLMIKE